MTSTDLGRAPDDPTATGPIPLLTVSDLTLRFGGVNTLRAVDFEVLAGELFAIIGPNGAGKTSIFNCLNGVYRPQSGSIRLDGEELVGRRPATIASRGIARTFQNLALFTNLDVIDNLMLGRHHLMRTGFVSGMVWVGRAKQDEVRHRRRCEEIADMLMLGPYRGVPVATLPYGVQKRIELGRALAMDPKVLLLDEPVAGMNVEETEAMARTILQVGAELALTTILVEHDMHLVMDLADRVLAINFGEVIAVGPPAVVQTDSSVIEAYLGGGG
ncbi:MAG TPA: ABC transporter ATP-binding protein [Acidimicrobiia bacterium]|jgi:branched-chain amino acid transport system ATP-binding protein